MARVLLGEGVVAAVTAGDVINLDVINGNVMVDVSITVLLLMTLGYFLLTLL